jgi:phospholipid/cholesterol/gamma-HCH transport system permease protein
MGRDPPPGIVVQWRGMSVATLPHDEGETPALRAEPGAAGAPALVTVTGAWTLPMLAGRFTDLEVKVESLARHASAWDLRGIGSLDGAGAVLLWRGWSHQRPPQLRLRPEHEAIFRALAAAPLRPPRRERTGELRVVRALLRAVDHGIDATRLAGQLAIDGAGWLRHPARIAWRETSANVYRAGALALPITALVGFLVGVTLSYLTSRQLKVYGADIFVVNILGIGVWRELGPMLAAILVAGRSGSAMTAQLGVMRVTQELDALSVMGISHTARLVLPKVLALALAMPLVTVWTCLVMLIGGMLAARAELGIDPVQFLRALPGAVPSGNVALGLSKSVGFGALIAFVACHFGLRVKPDTESLAAGTTASVVSSITVVIMLDALVAVLFSDVGF